MSTGEKLTFTSKDLARIGIRKKKRVGMLDEEGEERYMRNITNEVAFTTF